MSRREGEGGLGSNVTTCDKEGGGVPCQSDVTFFKRNLLTLWCPTALLGAVLASIFAPLLHPLTQGKTLDLDPEFGAIP